MKNEKKNILFLLVTSLFLVWAASCGKGESTGFNAPADSTVNLPTGGSYELGAGAKVFVVIDINVLIPLIPVTVFPVKVVEPSFQSTGIGQPGNNIQVQLTCFECEIYDKTDGSSYINDGTPRQLVASPYMVKTNSQGFYQVWVLLVSPADLGLTTYTASLAAGIGVASAVVNFTVTIPST